MIKDHSVTWASLGNLSLAARSIPGENVGIILLSQRKYASVQSSKVINYYALWYSFYNYWHFRQLYHMSIMVLRLTFKLQLIGWNSLGRQCWVRSLFSALRSTLIIYVQSCAEEICCEDWNKNRLGCVFLFS